jgi:hypothetical protein
MKYQYLRPAEEMLDPARSGREGATPQVACFLNPNPRPCTLNPEP